VLLPFAVQQTRIAKMEIVRSLEPLVTVNGVINPHTTLPKNSKLGYEEIIIF